MTSECQIKGKSSRGYYATTKRTKRGPTIYWHRIAWEAVHGPIPVGMDIHHRCGQRRCQNVAHMELLPHDEHAGGAGHGKLSRREAREVRAELYGISIALVSLIGNRKRWASV